MFVEELENLPPFTDWLLGSGLPIFLGILLVLLAAGVFIGYLIAARRHGPTEGFYVVARVLADGVSDLLHTSPRRIWAVARLAIQEAVRRRVLVGFAVFLLLLLFAGWFLDVDSEHPARLYLSFVLTATSWLAILVALFLSTFSLPSDIKNRTIYTVVTKPVRASEIVLGRIVGFSLIGTAMVLVMCGVSYAFVTRGVSHGHAVSVDDVQPTYSAAVTDAQGNVVEPERLIGYEGETSYNSHHRHSFRLTRDNEGWSGWTDLQKGHRHFVQMTGEWPNVTFEVGSPQGALEARVPIFGELQMYDRAGNPAEGGVSVGYESDYRSFVEGLTGAAAAYEFDGVTPANFPDRLPVEMNIEVFRTHKGDIERGIAGSLTLKNPNPQAPIQSSKPRTFRAEEFQIDQQFFPINLEAESGGWDVLTLNDGEERWGRIVEDQGDALVFRERGEDRTTLIPAGDIDQVQNNRAHLFRDLTDNGRLEVWLRCEEPAQYYGVGRYDVYLRAADGYFWLNFVKGHVSIWLQMVIVICFGVMFSTVLNAAVGMLGALFTVVVGLWSEQIQELTQGIVYGAEEAEVYGGGPIESLIRLLTQKNVMVPLELPAPVLNSIQGVDKALLFVIDLMARALPDYTRFNMADVVAHGYNISFGHLGVYGLITLAYVLVLSIFGYFLLKTREIAA